MSDKLSLYDYLGFIVPGAVILATVVQPPNRQRLDQTRITAGATKIP